MREVSGVPPQVAVYRRVEHERRSTSTPATPTELPDHPLHDRIHGSPDRPRRRARGERVPDRRRDRADTWGYAVVTVAGRSVTVGIDARRAIDGVRPRRPAVPRARRSACGSTATDAAREVMLAAPDRAAAVRFAPGWRRRRRRPHLRARIAFRALIGGGSLPRLARPAAAVGAPGGPGDLGSRTSVGGFDASRVFWIALAVATVLARARAVAALALGVRRAGRRRARARGRRRARAALDGGRHVPVRLRRRRAPA